VELTSAALQVAVEQKFNTARHHALNDLVALVHAPKSHLVLADPVGNGRMVFL